jgi:UDP-N-acetylglucosamine 2-epimerase (hydrolysing)
MSADPAPGPGGPARRQLWFLTGTRADFGKLKPLILAADARADVDVTVVATGMHLLDRYGFTVLEVRRLPGSIRVREVANQAEGAGMDAILADTITALGTLVADGAPDLLVVHGDRVEALAGASFGALRRIPVAHVEGGERSGTIDGILRHAITKLSHLHLVANDEAARRVEQLGEDPATIRVIGSPDIDAMLADDLPTLDEVRAAYEIGFDRYALVLFHGVTTERPETVGATARALLDAVRSTGLPAIVIYPNNDPGSDAILDVYGELAGADDLRIFPSVRFEAFLTLLHAAEVVVGNSSAGIREAPLYGVPTVNVGTRQRDRFHHASIISCGGTPDEIRAALETALALERAPEAGHFGGGDSAERFAALLAEPATWEIDLDKRFLDLAPGDR